MINPLVTIGLPVFNREIFIKECIDSILNQSYLEFELIIFDDCSSDNSWEIINSFTDNRIKLLRGNKNLGPPHPLNEILKHANGDYFMYLGDWDFFDKDLIKECVGAFLENPDASFIHPGAYTLNQDSGEKIDELFHSPKILDGKEYVKSYLNKFNNFNFSFHPHSLFRIDDLLNRNIIYDHAFYIYADIDLTLHFLSLRKNFIYINKGLLTLRERDSKHFLNDKTFETIAWLFEINKKHIKKNFHYHGWALFLLRIKFEKEFFKAYAQSIASADDIDFFIRSLKEKYGFKKSAFNVLLSSLFFGRILKLILSPLKQLKAIMLNSKKR